VDQTKISTSGISSGAAMATQLHVAYSSKIMGVGLVAGSKSRVLYIISSEPAVAEPGRDVF